MRMTLASVAVVVACFSTALSAGAAPPTPSVNVVNTDPIPVVGAVEVMPNDESAPVLVTEMPMPDSVSFIRTMEVGSIFTGGPESSQLSQLVDATDPMFDQPVLLEAVLLTARIRLQVSPSLTCRNRVYARVDGALVEIGRLLVSGSRPAEQTSADVGDSLLIQLPRPIRLTLGGTEGVTDLVTEAFGDACDVSTLFYMYAER